MSFQVTTSFVKQFSQNVNLLSQQRGSRLSNCCLYEGVVGEDFFMEQLGSTEAVKKTDRHGDSPIVSTPHHRRKGTVDDYEWGDMIDKEDQVRMLIDPASKYVQNGAYAMGRAKDDVIIAAFDATAYTGKSGTTAKTLPASQKVGVDLNADGTNENLSYEKLLYARTILVNNNVDLKDPQNELYILVTPWQVRALLNQTEVKSADYNTVKALAQGEIDSYMGFKFIELSDKRVLTDSSGYRRCIAWVKSGMAYGVGNETEVNVKKRADKSFNWYVHMKQTVGATRLEEEKVVQILCDETVALTE